MKKQTVLKTATLTIVLLTSVLLGGGAASLSVRHSAISNQELRSASAKNAGQSKQVLVRSDSKGGDIGRS